MPLPFILWGGAAALAALGVAKGVEASGNFEKAKEIGDRAEKRHKQAVIELEEARAKTQLRLEELGQLKVHVFTKQIKHLVDVLHKVKYASSKLKDFNVKLTTEEIKEYEQMVLGSLELEKGLATGAVGGALAAMGAYGTVGTLATASTGAAISGLSGAAATNATLAWLGGGALGSGTAAFGMAGGMVALGGIILGPALAIGGFMMAGKAEEALTQAYSYDAKVVESFTKIGAMKAVLNAYRDNADELTKVITGLASRFDACKVNDDLDQYAFERMVTLGIGLKKALDIAIINPDGTAVANIKSDLTGLIELKGEDIPTAIQSSEPVAIKSPAANQDNPDDYIPRSFSHDDSDN